MSEYINNVEYAIKAMDGMKNVAQRAAPENGTIAPAGVSEVRRRAQGFGRSRRRRFGDNPSVSFADSSPGRGALWAESYGLIFGGGWGTIGAKGA